MNNRTTATLATVALAGMVGLVGCSSGTAETLDNGDQKDVTIAVFQGWDEGVAASYLWKAVLEEKGYDVELEDADVAPVYEGLSSGDYDLVLDTWLPQTHKTYMDRYGKDVTDLGAWNDDAKLTIAVNEDAPIDSLEELADNADLFDNRLIGIEPGAGLTEATQEKVIPGYGLEDMEYLTSSTAAMLSELKSRTDAGENVVVTLWTPHWAYDAFPLKDLADPQGTLGDAESIHSVSSKQFGDKFPTLEGWIKNFTMDSDQLYSLENAMFNENSSDDYEPIVAKWIEDNRAYVDSLTK
ncbi:glycine betaine ABC transporter substrate-binding protein [Okibacterium fritillariae]|uniref:Glycine betaine/proline transport system substrate-binding protein n=1 Tax=Okibacterium fritillariae TaxID=123320 RepID=A0A1T5I7D7_9MICO|nr:glycine betaine ABC transporter substrate-binding protein [Okibacterium fritillariae]SKC35038.1 glycine betaine/proline transport system substrate-binding protein [Okibacterium fritillariae]